MGAGGSISGTLNSSRSHGLSESQSGGNYSAAGVPSYDVGAQPKELAGDHIYSFLPCIEEVDSPEKLAPLVNAVPITTNAALRDAALGGTQETTRSTWAMTGAAEDGLIEPIDAKTEDTTKKLGLEQQLEQRLRMLKEEAQNFERVRKLKDEAAELERVKKLREEIAEFEQRAQTTRDTKATDEEDWRARSQEQMRGVIKTPQPPPLAPIEDTEKGGGATSKRKTRSEMAAEAAAKEVEEAAAAKEQAKAADEAKNKIKKGTKRHRVTRFG